MFLGVTNYLVMQWVPRSIFGGALTTLAPLGCDCVLVEKQEKKYNIPVFGYTTPSRF